MSEPGLLSGAAASIGAALGELGDFTILAQPLIYYRDANSQTTVEGREIDFRDNLTGQHGRVRIPLSHYNAENVRKLVLEQIAHIRAVHALSS